MRHKETKYSVTKKQFELLLNLYIFEFEAIFVAKNVRSLLQFYARCMFEKCDNNCSPMHTVPKKEKKILKRSNYAPPFF